MMDLSHGTDGNRWWVLHTKSRCEKKLRDVCFSRCSQTFLPLTRSITRNRGRIFEFTKPLFPGYLFSCFKRDTRRELFKTGHLANIIEVVDQNGLLRDLSEIHKATTRTSSLEPFRYLKRGRRARIISGPFEGIEGIVSHRRGKYRVVLNVNLIQMAAAVEVCVHQIEPIDISPTRAGATN